MSKKPETFSKFIQNARNRLGLSLRAVEEATGVSNAYLSQLEQGKIKQPSPLILHKLSEVYQIPYSELFRLVGYPVTDGSIDTEAPARASRLGPITQDEEDSLAEYLQFLRTRSRGK